MMFQGARYCPECGTGFDQSLPLKMCPLHQTRLETVDIPLQALGNSFEIIDLLGSGSFGLVFKARQKQFERDVAIKLMHRHLLPRTDAIQRFQREAALIERIKHPNVTSLYDYGLLASGEPYIIMELLAGLNLEELMRRRGRMGLEETYELFNQLLAGVEAAHDHRILHRDLKPGNIRIMNAGEATATAKIMDFGLARLTDKSADQQRLTQSGYGVGTPAYMSPEALIGTNVDERTDVFSLGCVLYEMLVGLPANQSIARFAPAARKGNAALHDLLFGMVPSAVRDYINKSVASDPDCRFSSVAEMREAWRETYHSSKKQTAKRTFAVLKRLLSGPLLAHAIPGLQDDAATKRVLEASALLSLKHIDSCDNAHLPSLVEACMASVAKVGSIRGISIAAHVDRSLSAPIALDRTLLYLILRELVSNAVEYGETFTTIECTADGALSIMNDGVWLEKRSKAHNGNGVGLKIVEHLCNLLGARFTIGVSATGNGTTAAVRLPLQKRQFTSPETTSLLPTDVQVYVLAKHKEVVRCIVESLQSLGIKGTACASFDGVPQIDRNHLVCTFDLPVNDDGAIQFTTPVPMIHLLNAILQSVYTREAKSHDGAPMPVRNEFSSELPDGFQILDDQGEEDDETTAAAAVIDHTEPLSIGGAGTIDIRSLEQSCGRETAAQIVENFRASSSNLVKLIEAAISQSQGKSLQSLAHQLGASANAINAWEISRLASRLQHAASTSDMEEAAVLATALSASMAKIDLICCQQSLRASQVGAKPREDA